jgi:hypothetical protein
MPTGLQCSTVRLSPDDPDVSFFRTLIRDPTRGIRAISVVVMPCAGRILVGVRSKGTSDCTFADEADSHGENLAVTLRVGPFG